VTVGSLGIAAFATPKTQADTFWNSITAAPNSTGAPTKLAEGANQIALDGRVHLDVTDSVAQIHAPEAWNAGFDGSGTTVAVLDSGYDPTYADITDHVVNPAVDVKNFTTDPDAVDHVGHGTHVASIIAGTGENGIATGVAPGADLLIGKVIDNSGYGLDSMILAGMQWAVNQHADVVNMSLGGDITDGTDVLSAAVDQLSASSDTLFVVAAGNSGSGPQTVTAPGAAGSALTVGAVDGTDAMAWFSGRGPRVGDGIVKPDLVAPGVGILGARATGTSMGTVDPSNDKYTAADGTSMATPAVAGAAAIVAQEHPAWTGQQIKDAIVGSTVPVLTTPTDNAPVTAFDAGTGRVDALRATQADVVSDPALNLGFFKYPQTSLPTTTKQLNYTNTTGSAVTLSLSLVNEDGTAVDLPGVTLAASQVVVPANANASVDITVDPTAAATGSYSGVVIATPDNGGNDVRTAVGFTIESEHYDLTLNLIPRADSTEAAHVISVMGPEWQDKNVDSSPGTKTVTFRLEPGRYYFNDIMTGAQPDGSSSVTIAWAPSVDLHSDTTVTLDANDAKEATYQTDRPVVDNGIVAALAMSSNGLVAFGAYDHVYIPPAVTTTDESVSTYLKWDLAQPLGTLTAGADSVALRGVPAANGVILRDAAVPLLSGNYPVVDAGSVGALDTSAVSGAIATVAGDCTDLGPTAAALAASGAVAMVVYPGDGQRCVGTLARPRPIPAYYMSAPQRSTLSSIVASGTGSMVTRESPHYVYDLQGMWDDSVPAAPVLYGDSAHTATFVEHVDTPGRLSRKAELFAFAAGFHNGGTLGSIVAPFRAPQTLRHYVSIGFDWEREMIAQLKSNGVALGTVSAASVTPTAGEVVHTNWFGGPLTARLSPEPSTIGWAGYPSRYYDSWAGGDVLDASFPLFTDAAGHMTGMSDYAFDYWGKVWRNGTLLFKTRYPGLSGILAGKGTSHWRVYSRVYHENLFWKRSTDVTTQWGFTSTPLRGKSHALLPMLSVDYRMKMSPTQTVAPGTYRFGVSYRLPYKNWSPLKKQQVWVSWNDGDTWKPANVVHCSNNDPGSDTTLGGCTVQVNNRHHGNLSLKVRGVDGEGNSASQVVIRAYHVS
jgi:subtilisin family serine protease